MRTVGGAFFAAVYAAFALCLLTAALVIVAFAEDNSIFLYSAIYPVLLAVLIGYFVFCDAAKRARCCKCLKDGVQLKARCDKVMATPPSYAKNKNKYI